MIIIEIINELRGRIQAEIEATLMAINPCGSMHKVKFAEGHMPIVDFRHHEDGRRVTLEWARLEGEERALAFYGSLRHEVADSEPDFEVNPDNLQVDDLFQILHFLRQIKENPDG